MRKKDNKVYTVNRYNQAKWNRPMFMPEENIFAGTQPGSNQMNVWTKEALKTPEGLMAASLGFDPTEMYKQSKNAFGISKADNPFSKGNIAGGLGAMAKTPIGGAAIGAVGSIGNKLAYDAISGGLSSGVGAGISNIGNAIGDVIPNPLLGTAVKIGSGIIGGGVNAVIGTSVDKEKKVANDAGTAQLNSFTSNASTTDDVQGITAVANVQDAHKGGLAKKGWAREQNEEDRRRRAEAVAFAQNSLFNNIGNIGQNQLNDQLANYVAFGGPIDTTDMGAIEYGFMADYLNSKKRQVQDKNKMTNMFAGTPSSMFDFGGDLQTDSSDYSVGKIYDISEAEANRLKSLGYEFIVVG